MGFIYSTQCEYSCLTADVIMCLILGFLHISWDWGLMLSMCILPSYSLNPLNSEIHLTPRVSSTEE